jgi:hypothetical protein
MMTLALCVVFLLPAYHLAKSKGYNILPLLIALTFLGVAIPIAIHIVFDRLYPVMEIAFPALSLVVAWLLPTKEGAPGKKYLKITFDCPECKEEVVFPRSKEGSPELCPKCNEIITVPMDEFSMKPSTPKRTKPSIESGHVCYASFGDEMLAVQMQALFEDNEIESEIRGGTAGGSLPQLSGTQGFKLSINIEDWDRAVEIEKTANQPSDPV